MAIINQRGVRSAATPNIYIERITIAPGGAVDSRTESSVDRSRPPARTTDRFGDLKFETAPATGATITPPVQRSLVSILRVSLKDLQNASSLDSTWVYSEPSRRNIVYKVIQSTNENLTNILSNSNLLDQPNFQIPANFNETIDYQIKTFSLSLQTQDDAIVSFERASGGNNVLSLEREILFQMVREPEHLTYFAFTEFHREGARAVVNTHSPIVVEKVIENSSIIKNTYVYKSPDGSVWPGPVHFHPGTGWMEGAFHTPQRHDGLSRIQYFNSKICDIRAIHRVEELTVDISPVMPTTDQNESYTTDLYLTRDQNGNCILMFGFDHLGYMQQNSKFGGLFSTAPAALRNQLMGQSNILELSVVRQKVREARGTSPLGSDDIQYVNDQEAPAEIVTSYDVNGVIQPRSKYYILGAQNNRAIEVNSDEAVSDQYRMFGKIEEVAVDNSGRFRTFAAVDAKIADINAGVYKYHIRLRVNDAAASYVGQKAQELSLAINVLENYLSIAERSNNYNTRTRRYTIDFINRMSSRRSEESVLPWLAAIVKYIEVLDLATNLTQAHKTALSDCLYTLVSPSTGTNDGVLLLLQLMRELSGRIAFLASDNRQLHQEGNSPPQSSVSQRTSARILTDEVHFQQAFNCDVLSMTGFDYFEVPNPTINQIDPPGGALILRREELRDRLTREVNRYRGNQLSTQELQAIRFLSEEAIGALTAEGTLYSYIAPNSVDLQGTTIPLLTAGSDSLDYISATSIIQNVVDNPSSRSFTTRSTRAPALATRLGSGPSVERLAALSTIESETSRHQGISSRRSPSARQGGRRATRQQRRQQERQGRQQRRRSAEEYFGANNEFSREETAPVELATTVLSDTLSPGGATAPSRTRHAPPLGAATTRRATRNRVRATSTTEGLDARRQGGFSFDLAAQNNFISIRILSATGVPDPIAVIRALPQQIKYLTMNRSQFYNDAAARVSTQNDSETDGFMYNFGMIRRIEYLSGYSGNYGKSPNWLPLTERVVNELNGALLCRIRKYTDPNTEIGTFHMLDQLPVYNEFFLLAATQNSIRPRPRISSAPRSQPRRDGGILSIDSRSIYGGAESIIAEQLTLRATADASIDGHVEYLSTTPYKAPTNSMRIITGLEGSTQSQSQQRQQRQQQQGSSSRRRPRQSRAALRQQARSNRRPAPPASGLPPESRMRDIYGGGATTRPAPPPGPGNPGEFDAGASAPTTRPGTGGSGGTGGGY